MVFGPLLQKRIVHRAHAQHSVNMEVAIVLDASNAGELNNAQRVHCLLAATHRRVHHQGPVQYNRIISKKVACVEVADVHLGSDKILTRTTMRNGDTIQNNPTLPNFLNFLHFEQGEWVSNLAAQISLGTHNGMVIGKNVFTAVNSSVAPASRLLGQYNRIISKKVACIEVADVHAETQDFGSNGDAQQ